MDATVHVLLCDIPSTAGAAWELRALGLTLDLVLVLLQVTGEPCPFYSWIPVGSDMRVV